MKNSNYTGRCPRTISEAFGQDASNYITEPKETGYSWLWWAAISVVTVVALIVIVTGEAVQS